MSNASPSVSAFWIGRNLTNELLACESRYLDTSHELSLSSRNAS